jgi:mRNA-degrading endonuclease toxin of MazEF toxin-antitoxin module
MVRVTHPRRGEVWEFVQGSRQYRVLIVSNDEFNEMPGTLPWALPVGHEIRAVPGHLVAMTTKDPLPGGIVVVSRVMRCEPSAMRHNLGFVADETINRVERGLRDFLNLP